MKNSVKYGLAVIVIMICFALVFTACVEPGGGGGGGGGGGSGGPQQLSAPLNLQINDDVLTWDAVNNASGYTVNVDGIEYNAVTNSFSLLILNDYKTYILKVKALGNGTTYTGSAWSSTEDYELEEPNLSALNTPPNIQISGTNLTWDTVTGAVRYSIDIDGVPYMTATNSYSLAELFEEKTYTIKIRAIGDNVTYKHSAWSGFISHIVQGSLLFTLIDKGTAYSVSKGTATAAEIVIPSVYKGLPVTTIPVTGFQNYTTLTSISIPNSVTSIGLRAFQGCSSLTFITIPFAGKELTGTTDTHFGFIFGGGSSYSGQNSSIPASLKTINITGDNNIKNNAFRDCSGLTSVTIGNSVTSIGEYAFYSCSGLASVTIGNSVTTIGLSAFDRCSGLASVAIGNSVTTIGNAAFRSCSELTSVTIPNSVTTIGSSAFSGCNKLASVIISGSVTSIGSSAFENCSGLKSVTIDNSVTSIGSSAFKNCSGLTSITIPNSVTSIGSSAFEGCSGLVSITIPFVGSSLTPYLFTHFGYIFGAGTYSSNNSYVPSSLKTVIITGGNIISRDAFRYCIGLESVTIPNSVTSIGVSAFQDCSGLKSITIPDSVTSIGSYAFWDCSGLENVTIGNSVTSIGAQVFESCIGLTSIIIPNSVTSIGGWVFQYCTGLTSITIPFVGNTPNGSTNTHFGYIFGGGSSYSGQNTSIPSSLKTVIITGGSSIRDNAFNGCSGLTSVTIPNSVTSIGSSSFEGCSGLPSITIPNSVTSIGNSAFYGCSGLPSITIPNSVTTIGGSAFRNCNGLTSVTIPFVGNTLNGTTNTHFGYIFGMSAYDSTSTIPTSLKTVTITGGNSIGNNAFSGCSGLTSIIIPDSVTTIGNDAFRGCSSLPSVTIPNNVTTIGNDAFRGCSSLPNIIIPDKVTSIGSSAFEGCSGFTGNLTIPGSVTSIGLRAFQGCSGLTSITIPFVGNTLTGTTNTHFGYIFGGGSSYSGQNSSIPPSLKTVIITGGNIGNNAFEGCSGLTSITIPNNVTSIGEFVFNDCNGLTSIIIPNNVTSIGRNAFQNCRGLTSVTIPNSVTSIDLYAFFNCTGLTTVFYGGTDAAAWSRITISTYNNTSLTSATRHYYSETQLAGRWRFVDGVPTLW